MERHPEAQPIFSRLGRAHLVVESTDRLEKINPRIMLGGVAAVLVATLLVTAQLKPTVDQDTISTSQSLVPQVASDVRSLCPVSDSDYSGKISDWLSKRNIEPVEISQEAQVEIGGIRSRVLLVRCQLSQKRVRLTEVKQKGTWQIKETAQLEN